MTARAASRRCRISLGTVAENRLASGEGVAPFKRKLSRASERGSLLICTMLMAAIISVSLVSYINLATTALTTANRSFYANSSVDLAECGIEQAMASFYQLSAGTAAATAWSGWTISGLNATRTFSGFTPGPNTAGVVRVYVENYAMNSIPKIVAKATISPLRSPVIEKYVEVTLRPRSLFSMGMVARNTLRFTGNANVDSWNSDPDNDSTTAAVAYSTGVRHASGTVGSVSATNGAIDIGNGAVYGYVDTGGGTLSYGSSAVVSGSVTGSGVDTARVLTDFSATFPAVTLPSPSYTNTVAANPPSGTSFPRTGDTAASDTKFYYTFGIGTAIDLNGTDSVAITGNCVFLFNNHAGVTAIGTSGNGSVTIGSTASLVVYTNGNIVNTGNGFVNNSTQPQKCVIYGTNTTSGGQSVTMSGNGNGGAAFYMPNASVTVNGNGDIRGAIVANSINMTGNAGFHYDEALGNFNASAGVHVSKWKELQASSERSAYATQLNF